MVERNRGMLGILNFDYRITDSPVSYQASC